MDLDKHYYAICDSLRIPELEGFRCITFGQDLGLEIRVKNSSIGKTLDGFDAVRFFVEKVEFGRAWGYIANYENGAVWKSIPEDSLTEEKDVNLCHINP